MIWNHDARARQVTTQNHMTPLLPSKCETRFLTSLSEFLA
jgi:hypothetical protein